FDEASIEIDEVLKELYYPRAQGLGFASMSNSNGELDWAKDKSKELPLDKDLITQSYCINKDKNMIIFTQDVEGRKSLYQIEKADGTWGEPYPLRGFVNKNVSDEQDPFISSDGKKLYFSSNREGTTGGFDIYKSEWNESKQEWSHALNLGYPINTLDDELHFRATPSEQSFYLSSNRLDAKGGFDVYHFQKPGKLKIAGRISDTSSNMAVPFAEIRFQAVDDQSNVTTAFTDSDGYYEAYLDNADSYSLEVLLDTEVLYSTNFVSYQPTLSDYMTEDISVILAPESRQDLAYADGHWQSANVGERWTDMHNGATNDLGSSFDIFGTKFLSGGKVTLNNIYFDFNRYEISESFDPVLENIIVTLLQYPDLKIEIAGHTDNIGTDDFNISLSQLRADEVKNKLIQYGVEPSRIIAKGYGASMPLASNDDEKEGRELNRRIEIIASSENDTTTLLSISVLNDM
ncbi:MAG: OmpA family protein, partial [Bacteroidota bacterium]